MTVKEFAQYINDLLSNSPELADIEIKGAMQPSYPLSAYATLTVNYDEDGGDNHQVYIAVEANGDYSTSRAFEGDEQCEITG